mgnify:CR=1 FL=1
MQAVDVYLMYCALKAHFGKGDYDFVKYGGKSSATKDSFWKRTDRLFFVKTQRKYKKKQVIQDYLVSNFVQNTKGWLGDFNDENYIEWKKRTQSMSYNFKQELEKIGKVNILGVKDGQHPTLLKEYLGKRVSLETMVILDGILNYSKTWNTKLKDDYVWKDVYKLINDYKSFLKFDVTNFKFVLRELMA